MLKKYFYIHLSTKTINKRPSVKTNFQTPLIIRNGAVLRFSSGLFPTKVTRVSPDSAYKVSDLEIWNNKIYCREVYENRLTVTLVKQQPFLFVLLLLPLSHNPFMH